MPITLKRKSATVTTAASGGTTAGGAPAEPRQLPRKLIDVRQAAAYAGVSESTIWRWIKHHGLPTYRRGKLVRIDPAELVDFMRSDGQS